MPYKGSGPLTTDLLGGQVTMSFDTLTPVLPHIKAGKLRALAVTTAKRSSVLPDVPTMEEAGLKGFDIGTWFGILAPAATPKPIVAQLSAKIVEIVNSPDFQQRMLPPAPSRCPAIRQHSPSASTTRPPSSPSWSRMAR